MILSDVDHQTQILLLCLSALFPVLMGANVVKSYVSPATDCSNVLAYKSGVYNITTRLGAVRVYCDVVAGEKNDREQWTVSISMCFYLYYQMHPNVNDTMCNYYTYSRLTLCAVYI